MNDRNINNENEAETVIGIFDSADFAEYVLAALGDIDLQLFADEGGGDDAAGEEVDPQEGLNHTGSSDLSPTMKTYYNRTLLKNATPNLVHDLACEETDPPAHGKTVEWRKFNPLGKNTTELIEGVTPAPQMLAMSSITATVKQYGGYVILTDFIQMTAIDDQLQGASEELGNQAGVSMDTISRDALQQGTNKYFCHKWSSGAEVAAKPTARNGLDGTALLNVKEIMSCVAIMRKNNIRPMKDGYYLCIVHPYTSLDIMLDPRFEEWNKYTSPEKMWTNEIGRIGKVRFVESSEAKIYYGTTDSCAANTAVAGTLLVGAGAAKTTTVRGGQLRMIVKQVGSSGVDDALDQRGSAGWKAAKVTKIVNELAILRIEHNVSMPITEAN